MYERSDDFEMVRIGHDLDMHHTDNPNSTESSDTFCNWRSYIGLRYTAFGCGSSEYMQMVTRIANRTRFIANDRFAAENTAPIFVNKSLKATASKCESYDYRYTFHSRCKPDSDE